MILKSFIERLRVLASPFSGELAPFVLVAVLAALLCPLPGRMSGSVSVYLWTLPHTDLRQKSATETVFVLGTASIALARGLADPRVRAACFFVGAMALTMGLRPTNGAGLAQVATLNLYVLATNLTRDSARKIEGLLRALLALNGVVSLLFFVLRVDQFEGTGGLIRAAGTYNTPNALYPIGLCALAFASVRVFGTPSLRSSRTESILDATTLLTWLPLTLFTGSRSAWLGLAAIVAFTAFRRSTPASLKPLALGAAALIVVAAAVLRTGGVLSTPQNDRSFEGRTVLWKASLASFRASPLVGSGVNTILRTNPGQKRRGYAPADAKNVALNDLADYGILGTLCLGGFALSTCLTLRGRHSCSAAMTAQAVLAASFLAGIIDVPYLGEPIRTPGTATFLLILGLGARSPSDRRQD